MGPERQCLVIKETSPTLFKNDIAQEGKLKSFYSFFFSSVVGGLLVLSLLLLPISSLSAVTMYANTTRLAMIAADTAAYVVFWAVHSHTYQHYYHLLKYGRV